MKAEGRPRATAPADDEAMRGGAWEPTFHRRAARLKRWQGHIEPLEGPSMIRLLCHWCIVAGYFALMIYMGVVAARLRHLRPREQM